MPPGWFLRHSTRPALLASTRNSLGSRLFQLRSTNTLSQIQTQRTGLASTLSRNVRGSGSMLVTLALANGLSGPHRSAYKSRTVHTILRPAFPLVLSPSWSALLPLCEFPWLPSVVWICSRWLIAFSPHHYRRPNPKANLFNLQISVRLPNRP